MDNHVYLGDASFVKNLNDNSVDLIITLPPYFNLVDYKHNDQIGLAETYVEYIDSLNCVWKKCIKALKDTVTGDNNYI